MSLEIGGRADKAGNSYENGILARRLIELICEQAYSIEVEPLGDEGRGTEFVVARENGDKEYYQCKAANAGNTYWRPSDLRGYAVFENAKMHIMQGIKQRHTYHFVSPVAYDELDTLCNRARTSRDVEDFVSHQLTNKSLKKWWKACCDYFCEDVSHIYFLISNCYFELTPDNLEQTHQMELILSLFLVDEQNSSPSALLIALKNFINEERLWGKQLTASDVLQSLEKYGFRLRIQESDPRILPRIHRINRRSRENYSPIENALFPREETLTILEHIHNGKSVLLLGRAGAGKSGCLQELMQKLDAEGILHLSLALDRFPSTCRTATQYGESLKLPDSPILCMHWISGGKPVVILFDQLDSLRWMNGAAANALDVCKEMIEEARGLNQYEDGHISIVFAARKFDYETDPGIKRLFEKQKESEPEWSKIEVGLLPENKVREIVGGAYPSLPSKLRELLKTPANLYIWLGLGNECRCQISSLRQLIEQWWQEIQQKCHDQEADVERIDQCRDRIVSVMQKREQLFLPMLSIDKYHREVDLLCSFGVLKKEKEQVCFVHQSFFDFFSVSRQIDDIYSKDCHISDFYMGRDNQTLDARYQVLMLLQYLMEADIHTFYEECTRMLQSDDFRFYFQCCTFDVLGQLESPDGMTWEFLEAYLYDEKWHTYIFRTVFFAHPAFIRLLFEKDRNFLWSDGEGRILLHSIMEQGSDLTVDIIEEMGVDRFATEDLYDILSADSNCRSARGFELRKELIRKHNELLKNDFNIYHMIEQKLPQAVDMLLILVEAASEIRGTMYLPDEKKLWSFVAQNAVLIVEKLSRAVLLKADQESDGKYPWQNPWFYRDTRVSCERGLVSIVQMANSWLAENEPELFLAHIHEPHEKATIEPEIVLHAMERLPVSYANAALEWLASDFEKNAFDKTSDKKTKLSACQRVIRRFSSHCDDVLFRRMEELIYKWSPAKDEMRRVMEYRLELRKNGDWCHYPAFWGDLQVLLLPSLDPQRISRDTKALLAVLRRRFPEGSHMYDNAQMSMVQIVSSPVEDHANQLSDKRWLSLIRDVSLGRVKQGRLNWEKGFDSSPEMFARSLYSAAKNDPVRFAKLSLRFPEDTHDDFCREIVCACESKDVPLELTCEVFRKLCCNPSRNMAIAFSRAISERADDDWPEDIIEMLIDIARNHLDPEGDSYPVHGMNANGDTICNDLWQSSINCARGYALQAISDLIWHQSERRERFEGILCASVEDINPAVCFAAMRCVYAWYNVDRALTRELFDKLIEHESRTLYLEEAGRLMMQFYDEDRNKYRAMLFIAVDSPITELHPKAARLIAALAIRDDWMLEQLLAMPLDEQKANVIFDEAVWMFESASHHVLGQRILLHLIDRKVAPHYAMKLFANRALNLEKDEDMLERLVFSGDTYTLSQALKYIYETEGRITDYVSVLTSYVQSKNRTANHFFELEYLAKCTARAFQQGKEDAQIRNACLDIWDALFKRYPLEMKALSEKID